MKSLSADVELEKIMFECDLVILYKPLLKYQKIYSFYPTIKIVILLSGQTSVLKILKIKKFSY